MSVQAADKLKDKFGDTVLETIEYRGETQPPPFKSAFR